MIVPGEPDYGEDLLEVDGDMDPLGRNTNGYLVLAQAQIRGLKIPTGSLPDDDEGDYGYDLESELSKGLTSEDLDRIPQRVELQVSLDDRIAGADVRATKLASGDIKLAAKIYPHVGGPFEMVLAASQLGVKLLKVVPS